MRRDSLLRSTPFRLAIVFAGMVVMAFVATGVAVDQLLGWELRQRQDQAIRETYTVIANAYGDSDLTDLLETVETNVRATREAQRVFAVTDRNGRILRGNVGAIDVPEGWSDIPGNVIGLAPELSYRIFLGVVDGHRLLVGTSRAELDSLQEILVSSLAWATLLVALIGIAGGAWLAHRARYRFAAVARTMNAVSQGQLSARIPLIGRGDDIDVLAQDINEALERLERTVEGMRQVSADVAHDLKTPLNRLRIAIDDALEKHRRGGTVVVELEEAAAEVDRINGTFEALLRISQIEAGSRRSRFVALEIDAVLASLVEIYRDVAEDAGDTLIFETHPASGPAIRGDRELLTQMFANLIENAIRHCPRGTSIRVAAVRAGPRIVVSVADDGPGIPEIERDKVFRRFYRLDKSRTSEGSGLGLSLVKAVADLHGAELSVEDGRPGTRIQIVFSAPWTGERAPARGTD